MISFEFTSKYFQKLITDVKNMEVASMFIFQEHRNDRLQFEYLAKNKKISTKNICQDDKKINLVSHLNNDESFRIKVDIVNIICVANAELKNRTGEVDKKIEEVTENTQSEIKNIENQGEKIKSLKEEALERYKQGIEMFNALSSQGEESVERKMNELWNHPSDPSGKKIEGLNTASENLEYFSGDIGYINDKSKLEEIYPYYESQTSNRYIGKLLVSIDGLAFAQGFNSAYVNKKNGVEIPVDINDRLKSYIDLAEKIKEIDDRKRKEYNDKINNTQK
jgi:hypothetical protein